MKISLTTGYTFNPVGRSIDFSGKSDFDLRRLYAVINVSADTLVYAVGKPGRGYKTFTNGVLALDYDTSGMSVQDVLLVLYEDGDSATNTKLEALRQEIVKLSTATGQASIATTLGSILSTLQAQVDFESAVWTDGANFYIRREAYNEGSGSYTTTWTDTNGAIIAAPAGARPASADSAINLITTFYDVVTAGTGYGTSDIIARVVAINKAVSPPTASSAIWINMTTGAVIAAPASANIAQQDQNTVISSPHIGAIGDAPATSDGGAFSIIALIKRGLQNWTSLLSQVGADPGSPPVANLGAGIRGWLATLASQSRRAFVSSDINTSAVIPANSIYRGGIRGNAGGSSHFKAMAQIDVSGATLDIYGSDDVFVGRQFKVASVAMSPGVLAVVDAPALFPNFRAQVTTGANPGTVTVLGTAYTEA